MHGRAHLLNGAEGLAIFEANFNKRWQAHLAPQPDANNPALDPRAVLHRPLYPYVASAKVKVTESNVVDSTGF